MLCSLRERGFLRMPPSAPNASYEKEAGTLGLISE